MKSVEATAHRPAAAESPLSDPQGHYGPRVVAASQTAAPWQEGDLDELGDDFDLLIWEEDFRQGSSELDLCGSCGRPTGVYLSVGEWVEHPVICGHCLTEYN